MEIHACFDCLTPQTLNTLAPMIVILWQTYNSHNFCQNVSSPYDIIQYINILWHYTHTKALKIPSRLSGIPPNKTEKKKISLQQPFKCNYNYSQMKIQIIISSRNLFTRTINFTEDLKTLKVTVMLVHKHKYSKSGLEFCKC